MRRYQQAGDEPKVVKVGAVKATRLQTNNHNSDVFEIDKPMDPLLIRPERI